MAKTESLFFKKASGHIGRQFVFKQRNAARVRLNVTRNRLYTSLIQEYFANEKAKLG